MQMIVSHKDLMPQDDDDPGHNTYRNLHDSCKSTRLKKKTKKQTLLPPSQDYTSD